MMTPKEKAEELVSKMARVDGYKDTIDLSTCYDAKQCALIAVDEIDYQLRTNIPNGNHTKRYWLEVKNEIKKL